MLSDHERRTLRDLERRLRDDDPEFPRSFDARARQLGRSRPGLPSVVAVAVLVVLGPILVAAGAPGAALGLAVVTALLWLTWRWCCATTSEGTSRDDHHST